MAATIRIQLLGAVRVYRGDRLLDGFPTQRAKSLFSFLVIHRGRMFAREVLAGRFCGDLPESLARRNLRSDLYRIRRTLEDAGDADRFLVVKDDQIGFNRAASYWLDVEEFERRLGAVRPLAVTLDTCAEVEQAVALYQGDLLEGTYDEWCLQEQERLRLMYLRGLERLMNHHFEAQDWHSALAYGEKLLTHDPLREHVHRLLMRCHHRLGDRAGAVRRFRMCEQLLHTELGVEPMAETMLLNRAILLDADDERPAPAVPISLALAASAAVTISLADATAVRADAARVESLDALYRCAEQLSVAQTHLQESIRLAETAQRAAARPGGSG